MKFRSRVRGDKKSVAECEARMKELNESVKTVENLDKVARSPAMEKRLCSNYCFAYGQQARGLLVTWRSIVERKEELKRMIESVCICDQESFIVHSLLMEDHSPAEVLRVNGLGLNCVKGRLPKIHGFFRDLYETYNWFEKTYTPVSMAVSNDKTLSPNSRYIFRLYEYSSLLEGIEDVSKSLLADMAEVSSSIAKHSKEIRVVISKRQSQRDEYMRRVEDARDSTKKYCPVCGQANDMRARNCFVCGKPFE